MESSKKIFIIFPSTSGHINPVSGLVYELVHTHRVECIFYGNVENRELIERSGARFRLFTHRNFAELVPPPIHERDKQPEPMFASFFNLMIDCSHAMLPSLLRDVDTDKPDLILFDSAFITVKYLIEALKSRRIPIKNVPFYPNFVYTKELMAYMPRFYQKNLSTLWAVVKIFFRQFYLSWKFDLSVYNPIGFMMRKSQVPKIVSVFPELHPRLSDYDETHHFVGQCASEEARSHELKDDPELKSLLDMFPVKSRQDMSKLPDKGLKFIFMSLGTVFVNNSEIFEKAIEAFRRFDERPGRGFKLAQFRILMSLGPPGYKLLSDKAATGGLQVPENILLRASVPQLDVLKRADLFITHCGMNSTSEAIKYAVPIVSIPIDGDQPLVAMRTCEELELGVRLDPMKLRVDEVSDAVERVLGNDKYRANMKEISEISSRYNGSVVGAQLIVDYLNDKEELIRPKRVVRTTYSNNKVSPTIEVVSAN